METDYFNHFMLLSKGIYILLKDSMEESEVYHVRKLFYNFCLKFPFLYDGDRHCTINIHQLVHLPDDVLELAGLWTHSCFGVENQNNFTLKLFHGTQNVEFQIVSAVCINQQFPLLATEVLDAEGDFKDLYNKLCRVPQNARETLIEYGILALGAPQNHRLDKDEVLATSEYLGYAVMTYDVLKFSRVRVCGDMINSTSYRRETSRNSYTVSYAEQGGIVCYGKIMYFFQLVDDENKVNNLAVVEVLSIIENEHVYTDPCTGGCAKHIKAVRVNSIKVIQIKDIQRKVVYIEESKTKAFVIPFPNIWEKD